MSLPTTWVQADWDYLVRYVEVLRQAFHLDHYEINLLDEPSGEYAIAEVKVHPSRRRASIRFCYDFRTHQPEAQRSALVHELIHIVEGDRDNLVYEDLREEYGPQVAPFVRIYARTMELSVDHLTSLLEESLPLPEWPTPSPKEPSDAKATVQAPPPPPA